MLANVSNYVVDVDAICATLLVSYKKLLEKKNVWTQQDLAQIIKIDLDKIRHALLEVKSNPADRVVSDFFRDDQELASTIVAHLKENSIYHLGFEVYEPLNIVLHSINHWAERSQQSLATRIKVNDYLRFPASQKFQRRVKAYTEIMRIWIQVDDQELMLELFDIHRPANALLLQENRKIEYHDCNGLFTSDTLAPKRQNDLPHLFKGDEIWHYAIYVNSPEYVRRLHTAFQSFVANNERYKLAYESIVINKHDGSVHTKIINLARGLELELVSQLDQHDGSAATDIEQRRQ